MSSMQISSSAADKAKQAGALVASKAKTVEVAPPPPPPPPPPAPEPAKSEFVKDTPAKKVTLDPTAGQKSLTELPELSGKLPKSFSASSLQLTGGKGADFTFTKTGSTAPTEAVTAKSTEGASTQSKVDEDAQRIAQEQQKNGPAAGVRTMETLLEERKNEPDFEEYRKQLLIAAEPTLHALADQVKRPQGDPKKAQELIAAVESVSRMATAAGPEATQRAARAFAAGMDDSYTTTQPGSPQAEAFAQLVKSEGGVTFATALTQELSAAGKTSSADQVGRAALGEVNAARADFKAKDDRVKELNAQLQRAIYDAGPALTPAQQQQIADEFRKKHGAEYDAWEQAAGRLAPYLKSPSAYDQLSADPSLPKGVRDEAQKGIAGTAELMDSLSHTREGAKWIAEEMMKAAKGEKTLLAQIGEYAKDRKDVGDKFALALGKGTAWAAMQDAQEGVDVNLVMKGLEKYADVFGLKQQDMAEVTQLFGEFKPGMSEEQIRDVSKRINDKLGGIDPSSPFGSEGARGQILRGIGLSFAAANLTGNWSEFGDASVGEKLKTIGDTISAGSDAGTLFMDAFSKAQSTGALSRFVKAAGPVGGVLTAIGDGIVAIEAFQKGDKGKALESGLMSAGGLFLAAASVQGFPVAGQVLGAALTVAGLGVKFYNEEQDKRELEQLKQELFGTVFKDDPVLRQAMLDADREQLNKLAGLGFSPSQMQRLGSTYPSLFSKGYGNGMEGLKNLQANFNMSAGELEAFLNTVGGGSEQTLMSFIQSMDSKTGVGINRPREEWIGLFEDLARTGPKSTREAYRRAAEALRTRSGATD
ncbi:MAG TPA: hypothetical protein VF815_22325 [Myxococcaceae bacterium]|jgi:hypothetical protein